jgi:radical SAM/Cys-rich protein
MRVSKIACANIHFVSPALCEIGYAALPLYLRSFTRADLMPPSSYLRPMAVIPTLYRRKHLLADPSLQREHLQNGPFADGRLPRFTTTVGQPLQPAPLEILQVNLGYQCNQTCAHCHVDAGPDRKEVMNRDTMTEVLNVLRSHPIRTLDLTGGAPEMNPDFRWLVSEARPLVSEIIVRSNLTIFSANARFADLPKFFANHQIRVISSLPCYTEANTDRQRGSGVFARSIQALKQLNQHGYGQAGSGLQLDLVYNPQGIGLPGNQAELEADYQRALKHDHDVVFNHLLTIANLPISRFLDELIRENRFETYMHKLLEAYNPSNLNGLMCRNTLSVAWDGRLYDCDFNQMLQLPLEANAPQHLRDFDFHSLAQRHIQTNQHCYGCTAGAGSSCQGALT